MCGRVLYSRDPSTKRLMSKEYVCIQKNTVHWRGEQRSKIFEIRCPKSTTDSKVAPVSHYAIPKRQGVEPPCQVQSVHFG